MMRARASNSTVIARLDRATQYAAASRFKFEASEYWILAFAGMTAGARG
jgi:hypothetical protein